MHIRSLIADDFDNLYQTFLAAFARNEVTFEPTREEFMYRIEQKLRYDRELSAASFDGGEMLGFILHTSGVYQGIPTAYNGGTGVLPGFRNQRTALSLYEFLIPRIQSRSIARILLEVVDSNGGALALYQKIGFQIKRKLRCYKQTGEFSSFSEAATVVGKISDANFDFNDFIPSFVDNAAHLLLGNEQVLLVKENEKVIGFLIFRPHSGRISQLAVDRQHRHRGIGEALVAEAGARAEKTLSIMNIPDSEDGFDSFLKRCGFENQVNQFEMEYII